MGAQFNVVALKFGAQMVPTELVVAQDILYTYTLIWLFTGSHLLTHQLLIQLIS
jgi:hypothetical protein